MKQIESTYKLLIADNYPIVREGIKHLINNHSFIEIIGETENSKNLFEKIKLLQPEIIIIDFNYPEYFQVEDIKAIYELLPDVSILVISSNENKNEILKSIEYGVINYILKNCEKKEFISALEATIKKERFLCGRVIDAILDKKFKSNIPAIKLNSKRGIKLSQREIEIIFYISNGFTNNQIAAKLELSIHTINTHRKNILKKLKLKKSSELIIYAINNGIILPTNNTIK